MCGCIHEIYRSISICEGGVLESACRVVRVCDHAVVVPVSRRMIFGRSVVACAALLLATAVLCRADQIDAEGIFGDELIHIHVVVRVVYYDLLYSLIIL